ncbi:Dabb family protein [Acidobacterium sp. S8]|uniref:Dabb family protein n=1 Tax=Acidobacterium sp. S8 TaxID=1641854 RepID=UPI00131ACA41|nr:Dabb family protein [Acidobacterium sp. S8]
MNIDDHAIQNKQKALKLSRLKALFFVPLKIQNLQGQIPGLIETYVGKNISPRGQGYTFGGVMKFTDQASLDAYGPHPLHQELLEWLVPLIDPIELDFEPQ